MSEKSEPSVAANGSQPDGTKIADQQPVAVGTDEEIEKLARQKSRRSFIVGGVAAAAERDAQLERRVS